MPKLNDFEKTRILLIEDDPDQIFMYQGKFELEGFKFLFTRSGHEGLKIAREERPHIILLDLLLNHEDGLDILAELKRGKATKDIPVIIITNLDKQKTEERGRKLGAVDYIIKSRVMPREIVARARQFLNG